MIRINLLPHREEKRRRRKSQYFVLAAMTAALALAIVGLVWLVLDRTVDNQNGRNAYLKSEIANLDKQIEEIKKIREETQDLLNKKQVVESLQANRAEPVQLLDQLLRQLPDGVYLKGVKQTGTKVTITGYAQSNARVSSLMRNLSGSPYVEDPKVTEIKAVTVNNVRANEFSLDVSVKRAKPVDTKGGRRPGAPAGVEKKA